MKLYLDTSSQKTILKLDNSTYEWESNRNLAKNLHSYIQEKLKENKKDWHDITELHFFTGPGSFTGLRIGATVINALGQELNIPIFDQNGEKIKIALPKYGRTANITVPRK